MNHEHDAPSSLPSEPQVPEAAEPAPAKKARAPRRKAGAAALPLETLPADTRDAEVAPPKPRRAPRRKPADAAQAPLTEALDGAAGLADAPSIAVVAPADPAPLQAATTELARAIDVVDVGGVDADATDAAGASESPRGPSWVVGAEHMPARVAQRLQDLLDEPEAAADASAEAVAAQTDESARGAQADAAQESKRVLAAEVDTPKLQKVLAQSGVGSRRDIETWIAEGKVEVNGEPAHVGQRIRVGDRVALNGKPVKIRIAPGLPRILAYHKPVGEIVTFNDPEGRPTVFRHLPKLQMGKWLSIGRLDINTEGLLLFTNNGDLANQLMHPRFGVEREYAVRTLGTLEDEQKARLLAGVEIDGQSAAFKSIDVAGGEGVNRWYRVVITEGRNREVRKLFDAVGLTVNRLIRVRYGNVVLPVGLKRGVWVELGGWDVKQIRRLAQPGQGAGASGERPARGERAERPERAERHERHEARTDRGPKGKGPRPERAERPEARPARTGEERRAHLDDEDDFIPRDINPLEQTFDRRFAKNKGRGLPMGFGHGVHQRDDRPAQKGGPREPDPMQTSMGYIGADSFHRRGGGGGGGGGRGGRGGGGGKGRR